MTTAIAPKRLGVVPSVMDIKKQLEACSLAKLADGFDRECVAMHLYGNLWPNADAPTLPRVLTLLERLSNETHEVTEDGYAKVPRDVWNELLALRAAFVAMDPVGRKEAAHESL
jgi:hypothetical protein